MRHRSVTLPSIAIALLLAGHAEAQSFAGGVAIRMNGFGATLAVGDGEVLVGEPGNTMRPGLVYLYRKGAGGWAEQTQLKAGDARDGDGFGAALALDGSTLAVGAVDQSRGTATVYLFAKEGAGWRQTGRLTADGGDAAAGFGRSIAIAGDEILVGAAGQAEGAGAVYRFRRGADGAWAAAGRIGASDAAPRAAFGAAVAVDGDVMAVSAPGADGNAGAVYTFRRQGGAWEQTSRLGARGGAAGDRLGTSLRVEAGHLLAGAPGMENRTGAVVAYQRDPQTGEWRETMRLRPFDARPQMGFGAAIASASGSVWVSGGGAAYVLERDAAGDFAGVRKLRSESGALGNALAASGDVAAAGMPGLDFGAGAAVIFDRGVATDLWGSRSVVMSEPEGVPAMVGRKRECANNKVGGLFDCNGVDLLGFLPVSAISHTRGTELNDIWGWTDPETGKEYALVGRFDGTAFVDISDPSNPVWVGDLPRTKGANAAAWRDIKTYRDHAYIVSDGAGAHGMQVVDLTKLRQYRGKPLDLTEDAHYDRINSVHNIVIDTATGYAYAVGSSSGGETCGGGLHMIDIREPENPKFAGCFADPQTGRASTGYTHDAQCTVYHGPDADYRGREICMGANETALSIADVTDKRNPKAIAHVSYPNVAYSHQGWFTADQRYFYLDDELDELGGDLPGTRTLIWDLSDLDDPQLVKEHFGATRATDHNLYIVGNLMYQSDYVSGLRILDISDPTNPVEVGSFDSVPWGDNAPGFGGSWSNYPFFKSGNIVFTSMQQGLFIVRKTRPIS